MELRRCLKRGEYQLLVIPYLETGGTFGNMPIEEFATHFLAPVVLVAMAWISLTALRLERVEAQANRRAAAEERTRLALWRMESALAPLITRESARP